MFRLQTTHNYGFGVVLVALTMVVSGCATPDEAPPVSTATTYTGARVIVGDGEVIENATFVVDGGRFIAVGATGEVDVPTGAATADLTGMTVMPAIIDAHTHLSTTREGVIADLELRAYFGIGAAMSLGADGLDAPLDLRADVTRYRSAGRGITRPEPGRNEVPHWIETAEEARVAVREEAARGVDIIKIWVDDRNGQYEKLTPEIYEAVIDEAHQNGLRVAAHIFTLEDAKGLLEADLDVFAHGVRDQDIDDEFVEMVQARPNTVLIPNMPGRGIPTDLSFIAGGLPADQIAELEANNVERPEQQEAFGIQARNLARLSAAGMTIAFGTDGNTAWAAHIEMEDMVASGMSASDVLVAATSHAASAAGFDNMGAVAAGNRADFVVLEANPLDDITNTRRIANVYLQGEAVDRSMP
jgi:imidazolonepropionase-like amidohydrolase